MLDISYINRLTDSSDIKLKNPKVSIGRVVDIILDDTHPQFNLFGKSDSIGMIKYRKLGSSSDIEKEEQDEYTGLAHPANRSSTLYPLINEIVLLDQGPSHDAENTSSTLKTYYTTVFSLYNHIHHNALPLDTEAEDVPIGEGIEERVDIAPLQPLPGDHIIQGRLGQSLRFSGGVSSKSPWSDDSNISQPITILRNGQKEVENGYLNLLEDINEDKTSIYLTSDHSIPLTLANDKRESYDNIPDNPEGYKGAQLLFNSDRVTINAKQSDILLSSELSVGINSKTVNIDAKEYMCIDADKIYLGVKSRTNQGAKKQPAVLGHRMEAYLEDLLNEVILLAKAMGSAKTIKGHNIPTINLQGKIGKSTLRKLKRQLNPRGSSNLKSNKLFIE